MIRSLIQELWSTAEQRFVTKRVKTNETGPGDSILAFIPLLLGKRLPAPIRTSLIAGLQTPGRFLTPFGFSTEALTSPLYNGNTYVKGPVWAPMNVFLSEALEKLGEVSFARTVRTRFLDACLHAGMSEHFDAKTGAAQGDPVYIWTSAMYLYLNRSRDGHFA